MMEKMMNAFQSAVENAKQQREDKKQREAAEAAWVKAQAASKVICDYFYAFFDKKEPGYNFLKENRQCMWVTVKENGVELSWNGSCPNAQSFREIREASKAAKKLIPFTQIYEWYGTSAGFYLRLDTKAKQQALGNMITDRVSTHQHIKYNGSISVKMFH